MAGTATSRGSTHALSALLLLVVVVLLAPAPVAAAPSTVTRFAGADRYATAADISSRSFDPGVETAVIATGEAAFDALAGSALASPLLLVRPAEVPAETDAELRRLQPRRIVVLGGSAAVADAVVEQLEQIAPVERVSGDSRYATAAAITAMAFAPDAANVLVVSGESFADALAAGAVAAAQQLPILMVERDRVPTVTEGELRRLAPRRITVIGGRGAVADGVLATLDGLTSGEAVRLAGADRYETSAVVSRIAYPAGAATVAVATGVAFPDALAGGAAAGARAAPILLVPGPCVTQPVADAAEASGAATLLIFGGVSAVSREVESLSVCPPPAPPPGGGVQAIGDSVMLGAKTQLEAIAPPWDVGVDAKVSRQFEHGIPLIQSAASARVPRVVVHLGTNGPISDAQFDRAMQAAGATPKVVFVTIQLPSGYSYEASNNDVLRRGAARWGAVVADWHSLSNAHPEYLAGDGYHLTTSGAQAYARLVEQSL